MSMTDALANQILDTILGTSGILPGTVYVGLLLALPNPDGTGVSEPAGAGYARQPVVNDVTNWPAAAARIKKHSGDIIFPQATGGNWGLIIGAGVFDAVSGGNIKLVGLLSTSRQVNDTDIFRFLAASKPLRLTLPWIT